MAAADALEWRQARQWLINSEVIPVTHRVTKPDVDLVDFARSLRDGVFLCSLLNTLKPDCVTDWNPKPMMQHSYLRNISTFLSACGTKFKIKESDLFAESDLYDVDNFQKVMHVLSKLSHTPEALSLGWVFFFTWSKKAGARKIYRHDCVISSESVCDLATQNGLYTETDKLAKESKAVLSKLLYECKDYSPFPREETRDYYNQVNNDDIYASLHDMSMNSERLYANVEDLYAEVPRDEDPYAYGNESIYDSICYYQAPPVKETDADEKKSYVLQEMFETERSFLTMLEIVSQDFYMALKDHISPEDTDLLFKIARSLYPVHKTLLGGFEKCVEPKHHDTGKTDIAKYFLEEQQGLLQYGPYAARLPQAVEKAKQLQNRPEMAKLLQQCQDHSNTRFPLSDLLSVPIQRFLKYPLLVKELHKCAKKCAMPSQSEVSNLDTVLGILEDIARYINTTKGDFENMNSIDELEQSFVDYRGPPLQDFGRYHLDGELRVKPVDAGGQPKSKWVFLFDKRILLCKKVNYKLFDVRYSPKQMYNVSDIRVEFQQSSHRGKFSFAFKLIVQGEGDFLAYAKTEEIRSQWVDAINHAKEMISPRDGKKGNHSFELHTFPEPSYCDVCHKLLHGCYYQGYSCTACNRAVHRECLKDVERCIFPSATVPPAHGVRGRHMPLGSTMSMELEPRSPGARRPWPSTLPNPLTNGLDKRGHIFFAKQRYEAIGSRSNRVLSFDKGEELEVMNPSISAEWWEAISLKTGNKGEVPASFLIKKQPVASMEEGVEPFESLSAQMPTRRSVGAGPLPISSFDVDGPPTATSPGGRRRDPMEERLRVYPWYLGKKSRIEAEQALIRMKDGVFLIRESDVRPGEYAVALKWNRMPKHIKVCKHPDTRKFYVSDVCDFLSVEELVAYYQQNSLGSSFPGVDTTLRYPYKEAAEGGAAIERTRPRSTSNPQQPAPALITAAVQALSLGAEKWADVLFTFVAEFPDELTIEKHDRVKIMDKDTNKLGWWFGECNGKTGLFPSNYVKEVAS